MDKVNGPIVCDLFGPIIFGDKHNIHGVEPKKYLHGVEMKWSSSALTKLRLRKWVTFRCYSM
jgi:hypothetical protein